MCALTSSSASTLSGAVKRMASFCVMIKYAKNTGLKGISAPRRLSVHAMVSLRQGPCTLVKRGWTRGEIPWEEGEYIHSQCIHHHSSRGGRSARDVGICMRRAGGVAMFIGELARKDFEHCAPFWGPL